MRLFKHSRKGQWITLPLSSGPVTVRIFPVRDPRTDEERQFDEMFQDVVLDDAMALTHPASGEAEVWSWDALTLADRAGLVADMREEAWDEMEAWERPPEDCPGCWAVSCDGWPL